MRHSENINPLCPFCQHSIFHYKIGEVVSAFYQGKWYDNAVILTLKPDVAVEWDDGQTTENMSKKDLKKLHGMQQQPTFYNPIFHVGEIVRAYPVNKKYSFNATICRIESGKSVVVRWHEEGSDNITKGLRRTDKST